MIKISFYICKCKTLLSLLNKQTSGLLFFIPIPSGVGVCQAQTSY